MLFLYFLQNSTTFLVIHRYNLNYVYFMYLQFHIDISNLNLVLHKLDTIYTVH